jgi:hypothetical protein
VTSGGLLSAATRKTPRISSEFPRERNKMLAVRPRCPFKPIFTVRWLARPAHHGFDGLMTRSQFIS